MACPNDDALLAMLEHTVDPVWFGELELHIDSCVDCRKAIAALALGSRPADAPHTPFADVAELAIGATIHGRYVVERELGRGGMGTVYVAHDTTLGRAVALKLHRAGSGDDRLRREAMAMAQLAHPNVVNVFEVASVDDRLYVAMEYVRGGTLRSWIDGAKRPWRETIAMLVAAGRGLAAAHAAGLVHRDFKPENVLVGEDGRPRVGDFGLARATEREQARPATPAEIDPQAGTRTPPDGAAGEGGVSTMTPPDGAAGQVGVRITRTPPDGAAGEGGVSTMTPPDGAAGEGGVSTMTGGIAGTPAYMAPEQLAGETVDARSDQFAFCVVAWECLFGRRPFGGQTLGALMLAIETHVLARPKISEVQERVSRVLERGLSKDPAARYPDVPALLDELEDAAVPRTRRNLVITALSLAAIGGAVWPIYAVATEHRQHAACAAERDEVRARFDDETRAVIQHAFTATGSGFARTAFERAANVLDRYTTSLADQTAAVCRDRDEPERVNEARRRCLGDRSSELSGLLDVFAHADADVVLRAPDAAWAMFDPQPCTDVAATSATVATPEQIAKLGVVKSRERTGRFAEGIELATALLVEAVTERNKSLELGVLLALGRLHQKLDVANAPATWHDAEALAEAQGRDLDAAIALDSLADAAGVEQHDYPSAHRQVELARAKLARVGGNAAIEGRLLMTEAQVLLFENRLGEAETAMRRGTATLEYVFGSDHPAVGAAYGTLSEILRAEGHHAEDLAVARHALDILSRALGDGDPTVTGAQLNLASALIDAKQLDEARALLGRADAGFLAVFGPDHPARAAVYGSLGGLEQSAEHWDAALAAFRTAKGIVERSEGAEAAGVAGVERDIAMTLGAQGKFDDALVASQHAVSILEKRGADGETRLGGALVDLAEIQIAREHPELALPLAERALAMATARPADANPAELADAQFLVARVLWDGHGDRARARELAVKARKTHPDPDKQAAIDTWLHAH